MPRPQEEVVGVGQDDRSINVVFEITGHHTLDTGLSADRHENGRGDDAMGGVELACPCASIRAHRLQFKLKGFQSSMVAADAMLT